MRGVSSAKNECEITSNHPVLKTGRALHTHIPRFLLARPDGKQELCNQRLHIIERHSGRYLLLDEWALFGMKVCQRFKSRKDVSMPQHLW